MPVSLRTKVFLPLLFLMALLIGYLYWYWMPQSLADMERQYQEATERHLDSVVEGLIPLLLGRELDTIYENLDALLKKNGDWISILLTDAADKPLYPLEEAPGSRSGLHAENARVLTMPITYLDKNLGTMTVTVDLAQHLTEWKREFYNAVSVMLVVIAFIVLSIGIVLERKVVQPVKTLEQAARNLAQGKFDALHLKTGDDEVGHLVGSFNTMRENLATSYNLLRQSEQKNRAITTTANDAIIMMDENGYVSFWNPAAESIFGYTADEVSGKYLHSIIVPDRYLAEYEKGFHSFRETGKGPAVGKTSEMVARRKDGVEFPVELSLSALWADDRWQAVGIVRDITQRKLTENRILSSLEEKELLLHEVHHRVKNNLQVIVSLLDLQLGHIGTRQPGEIFSEIKNRIKSMSLVHEKLYLAKDMSQVDLNDYVSTLVNNLYKFYSAGLEKVALTIRIDDIYISIDTAVPFGLIINELVTNSLKYAFPGGRAGEVFISVRKTGKKDDGRECYELTVKDNGIGLPEHVDIKEIKTLGLYLVTMLVEHQLRGTIDIKREGGTECTIIFKDLRYRKRI